MGREKRGADESNSITGLQALYARALQSLFQCNATAFIIALFVILLLVGRLLNVIEHNNNSICQDNCMNNGDVMFFVHFFIDHFVSSCAPIHAFGLPKQTFSPNWILCTINQSKIDLYIIIHVVSLLESSISTSNESGWNGGMTAIRIVERLRWFVYKCDKH